MDTLECFCIDFVLPNPVPEFANKILPNPVPEFANKILSNNVLFS
jgi:hypothetical protein